MRHFTAVLTITETSLAAAPANVVDRRHIAPSAEPKRDVAEVAKVVVRADSLDDLRAKIGAHVAIL